MKKQRYFSSVLKSFLFFALPNLLVIFSIAYNYDFIKEFVEGFLSPGFLFLCIVVYVAPLPIYMLLAPFASVVGIIGIPIAVLTGGMPEIAWWLWVLCFPGAWTGFSAFKLFGKYEEVSEMYESGSHIEVEFVSENRAVFKEVSEYRGGDEWIGNIWLYSFRYIYLFFFGIVPFLRDICEKQMNPIKQKKTIKGVLFFFYTMTGIMIAFTALFIFKPLFIFKNFALSGIILTYVYLLILYISLFITFAKAILHRHFWVMLSEIVISLTLIILGTYLPIAPVVINNIEDFEAITLLPAAEKRNYELKSDLDFNGKSSKVFGSLNNFNGTFDGNNHTIKNISEHSDAEYYDYYKEYYYYGFIPCLDSNGVIKNIRFDNIKINVYGGSENPIYVGIVVGKNYGAIENCLVTNCFLDTEENADNCYVGGISGISYNNSKIIDCAVINENNNLSKEGFNVGGISAKTELYSSSNKMVFKNLLTIQKTINSDGGIIYYNDRASLINCYNAFGESIVFENSSSQISEENVYTVNTPPRHKEDLPNVFSAWVYFEEFDCYIPCKGFESQAEKN